MKGQLRFLFIMMVVGMLFSCQRITRYHHYQPVGSDGWARTDTLTFRLPCVSGAHLLSVGLRHGPRFPYQELSVEAQTTIAPQGIVRRDTPVGKANKKKVVYRVSDGLFRFHHTFVSRYAAAIEAGMAERVAERICAGNFSSYNNAKHIL